jgi:hypothetical protein
MYVSNFAIKQLMGGGILQDVIKIKLIFTLNQCVS